MMAGGVNECFLADSTLIDTENIGKELDTHPETANLRPN